MLLVPEVDKPTLAVLKPETVHKGLILRGLIPTPTSQRERKEDPIESRKLEREMGKEDMEGGEREGQGRRESTCGVLLKARKSVHLSEGSVVMLGLRYTG